MKALVASIWRRLPLSIRRLAALVTESRFTVTVAAVVLNPSGQVLLLEHVFRPGTGWGIPGGFINPAEQPMDAIRRELREEVRIELHDVRLVSVRTVTSVRQVEILFLASTHDEPEPREFEIRSYQWATPGDLPPTISAQQKSYIRGAIEYATQKNPASPE